MRNKKLITLLVCLAMSAASVGIMSSCGNMFAVQSSSTESTTGESSVDDKNESSSDDKDENSSDGKNESSSDGKTENSSTSETKKEKYTVSFDGGNGSAVKTETVEEGETLEEPTALTKDYYTFDGWYNGETKWNFAEDTVSGEMTLTAKWTAKVYTVKFVGVDGATVVEEKTYTCENVDSFVEPEIPEAPEYFKDGHWDKTPEEYLIYSEEPIVVTAVYVRPEYTVKFVNGETEVSSGKVGEGLLLEEPTALTKDYYTFDGWYNG
ncbi:MAG: InlB B-repeat-containing protein, partial [Clostridia bacterium]|nr:InlB B-repeat-containing protein [Clostridia bacterium]